MVCGFELGVLGWFGFEGVVCFASCLIFVISVDGAGRAVF